MSKKKKKKRILKRNTFFFNSKLILKSLCFSFDLEIIGTRDVWPPRTFDPKDIWHQGHLTPRTFDPKDIWPQGHFTQGHMIQGSWKISEVTLSVFSWIKWDAHGTSILMLNKMLWIAPTTCNLAKTIIETFIHTSLRNLLIIFSPGKSKQIKPN